MPAFVGFVVNKVALGQAFLLEVPFSLVSIIPIMFHIHLLHFLVAGQAGEAYELSNKVIILSLGFKWLIFSVLNVQRLLISDLLTFTFLSEVG